MPGYCSISERIFRDAQCRIYKLGYFTQTQDAPKERFPGAGKEEATDQTRADLQSELDQQTVEM